MGVTRGSSEEEVTLRIPNCSIGHRYTEQGNVMEEDTTWDRDVRAFVIAIIQRNAQGGPFSHAASSPEFISGEATSIADEIEKRRAINDSKTR